MTTFHKWNGGYISFTKGAIDAFLDKSAHILTARGDQLRRTLKICGVPTNRWPDRASGSLRLQ